MSARVSRFWGIRGFGLSAIVLLALAGGMETAAARACPVAPQLPKRIDVLRANPNTPADTDAFDQEQDDYEASVKNIRRFTTFVGRSADGALKGAEARLSSAAGIVGTPTLPTPPGVDCLDAVFEQQARTGGLLDKTQQMQSGYEQQWALAGMSLAAFKLQRAGTPLSPGALAWLTQIAQQVMAFHDEHGQLNNHVLWAALGVGTTGYLSGQPQLIQWANSKVTQSLADTQPDGTLPREMRRGAKASHYHFFAAMPVMIYSDIRSCFGDPMPADERATLVRIDGALRQIIADPQWLAARAGQPQLPVGDSGWLDALDTGKVPASIEDHASGRLGGRLTNLVSALSCAR